MPITAVVSDTQALTLTVTADYPVPVERLWDAYADPRQLERFWGPVEWPATFTRHDMAVGGMSHYYMTGPDGTVSRGWFRFLAVEAPRFFEVEDGFADEYGAPNTTMPTMRMRFVFESAPQGSRFRSTTWFHTVEQMEQLVQMGMMEGMRSAMSQVDAVLADDASFAADRDTLLQRLGATRARVSRIIRGTVDQVWRAHHEPTRMQRWLLGPPGCTMPVCQIAAALGDSYRYEWASADGTQRFGFTGELLEQAPPTRTVTTERMLGTDGPSTRNELTLTPVQGGTLLSLVITYPSTEVREMILGTGMVSGMEASYARLERALLTREADDAETT